MPAPGPLPTAASRARPAEHRACCQSCDSPHDAPRTGSDPQDLCGNETVLGNIPATADLGAPRQFGAPVPALTKQESFHQSHQTASDHQSDRMLDEMPEGGEQLGACGAVNDAVITRQR